MSKVKIWKKSTASLLTTGFVLFNTAVAMAAPIELSLDDTVAAALKNNPAIKMAEADQEKSSWGLEEAKAGKMPTVSLGSNYNLHQTQPGGSDLSNSLKLNWSLYTGGRVEGQIDQANKGLASAGLGVEKAKQQIKQDAKTAYYNVLQARNLVKVNQDTVDSLKRHLENVQAKYAVGVVAKSDVLRSEVELANAGQNLIKATNSYDVAIAALNNVMNQEYTTDIVLKDELNYEKYDKSLAESLELAQKNRPDVAQADISVNVANTGVKIAESGKLPSVGFSAGKGWNDSILPDTADDWTMGVSASWNVFDAGVTKAKVKQADAALVKAQEQARQTRDSVELEVRQNYLNMQEAEKRLETTNMAVGKADEDLYIANEKYSAGVGTNLDVIDAQLALSQAKTNHIQALYDFNVNKTKLVKSTGEAAE